MPLKPATHFRLLIKKQETVTANAAFQLQNIADVHLIGADGNDSALKMVRYLCWWLFYCLQLQVLIM